MEQSARRLNGRRSLGIAWAIGGHIFIPAMLMLLATGSSQAVVSDLRRQAT
ncbi:MAG: hypothetical protein ACSLFF_10500 [Solirubrobacterales bacterium]